ncbi:MAG: CoA transferase [Burkholderiaceae bacterium]|nr:CoA transferase [Burkholderiaceae bacterium]
MSIASQDNQAALDGLRVLDLATFVAGPFCAAQLGEFGAEVIKVELPGAGDPLRRFGTPTPAGDTLCWLSEARNKKSVCLDLRRPEGADILRQLVAQSDVVIENFQPGTLESWGLGWDVLKQANPELILVRISGYGQSGPLKDRPGFGRIGNAFGGLSFLAGEPDGKPLTPGSATLPDYLAGIFAAFGAMVALEYRRKTGQGQIVDIGLYEPIFRVLDEILPSYQQTGFIRGRQGSGTLNAAPHNHYPTKDNKWVAIACTSDKIFSRLAQAMGQSELASPDKWGNLSPRLASRDQVDEAVTRWTLKYRMSEVISICEQHQVPCCGVMSIEDIVTNPQYLARGNILKTVDPLIGELHIPNSVPTLTATPGKVSSLGPKLGQHRDEILGGLLGLTESELLALEKKGVI